MINAGFIVYLILRGSLLRWFRYLLPVSGYFMHRPICKSGFLHNCIFRIFQCFTFLDWLYIVLSTFSALLSKRLTFRGNWRPWTYSCSSSSVIEVGLKKLFPDFSRLVWEKYPMLIDHWQQLLFVKCLKYIHFLNFPYWAVDYC